MLKKLLALLFDAVVYGTGNFLGQIVSLLLLPLYTQHLTRSEYGILSMLAIMPTIYLTLAAGGMKTAFFREFHRTAELREKRRAFNTALWSVFAYTSLLLIVGMLAARLIAQWLVQDENVVYLVRLCLIGCAITAFAEVPRNMLQIEQRVKTASFLNILQTFLTISLTVYFVVIADWHLEGVLWGRIWGNGLTAVILYLLTLVDIRPIFDWRLWRRMSAFAFPFLPHRLLAMLMDSMDEYLVMYLLGKEQAGLYYIATRFAAPITFCSVALNQAWTPFKYKIYAQDTKSGEFFSSAFTYLGAANLYLWVGVAVWGPLLVRKMTEVHFHEAAHFVWAVALIKTCQAMSPLLATGLELGETSFVVPLTAVGGLAAVSLGCYFLIPLWGATGAALSASLGWVAIGFGYLVLSQRQVRINYEWRSVLPLIAGACLFVLIGQQLQDLATIPYCVLAAALSICFPLYIACVLYLSPAENERMLILGRRLRNVVFAPR